MATHRSIYLLVFRSPIFPAHWALWIPSLSNPNIGKLINAVGDPATGFVHEFERNFQPSSYTSSATLAVLLSDKVEARYIADGEVNETDASKIDADAVDDMEKVALQVAPPDKSLNSVARAGEAGRKRVAIKNCQTWMREYIVKLVEVEILDQAAVDALDGAPKN